MIKFKTQIKDFNLPTSWSDIKFKDYLKLQSSSEIQAIQILTGLNEVEILMLDIEIITPYLEFLQDDPTKFEESNFIDNIELPFDLGEQSYEKKILACRDISNVYEVIKLYSGADCLELDCEVVFQAYCYLLNRLTKIIERDNERLKSEITIEQKMAGIDSFNELGDFNTIDMIAEKYNYTHEQVEQLPYNLIFLILLKQNISTKFEKNYSEIIKDK
jgi:hypothetical protein